MSESGDAVAAAGINAGETPAHIVDQLIAERGQKIVSSPFWPVLRPFLNLVLHYRRAVRMADSIASLSAEACLDYLSDLLSLRLTTRHCERVPASGSFILVANHPTGIADGIAVYDALKSRRRDLSIFTNRDAVRVNPRLAEVLIPVEWRTEFRTHGKTRETLRLAGSAFERGRAVVIFPSGRIAYWARGGLNERPWQSSAVALARRFGVPVLPVHVAARNSRLFYFFARVNTELRDMTVFHELLNKRGNQVEVVFGQPIPPEALAGDAAEVTARLQTFCAQDLARDSNAVFASDEESPAAK